jgi:hypothetical protein
MTKLRSIEEHNSEVMEFYNKREHTHVQCPICVGEQELLFTDNILRMSNPSQRQVKCEKCGYLDFIIV